VAGIAAISSLAGPESSGKQESEFQKAGQNLQTQELQDAQRAANSLDTLRFSGIGRGQQLLTDVSTLSRHLQQGDLAAARAAYQAVRHDVRQQKTQSAVEARAGTGPLPPGTVKLGANQAQQGERGKAEAGTPGIAPPASTSARQSIDISA
jgi:soluble cytochrome b562